MSIEGVFVLCFVSAVVFTLGRVLVYVGEREGKKIVSNLPLLDEICELAGVDRGDLAYAILHVSGICKKKYYDVQFYYHPSKPGNPSVRALVAVPVGSPVRVVPFGESQKVLPDGYEVLIARQIKVIAAR